MEEEKQNRIKELEWAMSQPDFWNDKERAQATIKEIGELKAEAEGVGKYDKGNAVITILSGAGGDDAEDFSRILSEMYFKFAENKNWSIYLIHKNENDHGGYRNLTFEMIGKNAYGILKNESGVHRLVRISPFNAKQLRHTSFSMVEVIPKFERIEEGEIKIPEDDIRVELSRSSGPGGQNVNKRETAVRVVHIPSNIAVHSDSERSQAQNKEKALEILRGKIYRKMEEDKKRKEKGMQIAGTMEIEWGSQIRSYVFHPYQMIKDHRTGFEERNIDKVLKEGELDGFIEAEKDL